MFHSPRVRRTQARRWLRGPGTLRPALPTGREVRRTEREAVAPGRPAGPCEDPAGLTMLGARSWVGTYRGWTRPPSPGLEERLGGVCPKIHFTLVTVSPSEVTQSLVEILKKDVCGLSPDFRPGFRLGMPSEEGLLVLFVVLGAGALTAWPGRAQALQSVYQHRVHSPFK